MKKIPERISLPAEKRIRETLSKQLFTLDQLRKRQPMNAEPDPDRKAAYVARKLDVPRDIAKKVAEYVRPETLALSEPKRTKAESIQGPTVDFMSVCFLDLGRAASRSVARVIFRDGNPQGSGFMVSPALFLTNNHVIPTPASAYEFFLQFNYEHDYQDKEAISTRYALDPDQFFFTAAEDDLDFTLVAIGKPIDTNGRLESFGFLPLVNANDKHITGMFMNCIQHPNGDPKQVVIRENLLVTRTANTLIYSSDTLPGSSGSPVFNDDWEVVALHHYGEPYRALIDQATGLPTNANEGIRISSIYARLQSLTGLTQDRQKLLNDALNQPFRQPSLMLTTTLEPARGDEKAETKETSKPTIQLMEQNSTSANVTTFTVPLTISVSLGNATPVVTASGSSSEALRATLGAEALAPEKPYSNRRGYNPNFLGVRVDLPELNGDQLKLAAKNKNARNSSSPFEFKYQHFSVVMNGERRLAFFTAVNIDGASVVKINRQTGQVTRGPESLGESGAEGRERWYDDDRIDSSEVYQDSIYRHPDFREFQRGHLVKRTDPSWGTEDAALKGQADTFHFTNCSPQHKDFNPNTNRWAGIENWITDTSDDEDLRVTVFSGPVFSDDDFELTDERVRIPKKFWKVVAWVEDDKLNALAMLADQTQLIAHLEPRGRRGEAKGEEAITDVPAKLREFQVTVADIEDVTGLNFGKLREHDSYQKREIINRPRAIKRFEDLSIKVPRRDAQPTA